MNLQKHVLAAAGVVFISILGGASADAQSFFQGFNGSFPADWARVNRSTGNSQTATRLWRFATAITDADSNVVVAPFEGDGFAVVSFNSTTASVGTISNWMFSPVLSLNNGDTFSFYTTTVPDSAFPDGLELRLGLNGASTDVGTTPTSVGDYSTLLLAINPGLTVGGYPETWTQFTATVSGLAGPTSGRFAFRYFVTNGGAGGDNSNIIAVDAVQYTAVAVPEPSTFALLGGVAIVGLAFSRRRSLKA